MKQAYFVGPDIAKNVFQVFLADEKGRQIENKKLARSKLAQYFAKLNSCTIGLEACETSNFGTRLLQDCGHELKLIQPMRVKAFPGNRNKTDAADAQAICEALMHPGTQFVSIKTEVQQDMDQSPGILTWRPLPRTMALPSSLRGLIRKGKPGFAVRRQTRNLARRG